MTEQREDADEGRTKQLWIAWRGWVLLAVFLLAVVVTLAVLGLTGVIETGFGEYRPTLGSPPSPERAKTLWDWMDLLLVPLVLAMGAALFTWITNRREQETEERRAKDLQQVELDRSRETALQSYLDRMTQLIVDGLRDSHPDDTKRSIARARTLTVLRQLDAGRKGLLLSFLHESDLIGQEAVVDLNGADLRGADLRRVDLHAARLCGADLREAKLGWANLQEADLHKAKLWFVSGLCANLQDADLRGADLRHSDLRAARFSRANLTDADLSGADLTELYLAAPDMRTGFLPDDLFMDDTGTLDHSMGWISAASLDRATLTAARLGGTRLEKSNLYGANLRQAYLGGADLRHAYLSNADLHRAVLEYADLSEADLRGTRLSAALLLGTILCHADLSDADLSKARLKDADLTGADVTDEQLAVVASLEGAIMPDGTVHE